jgi:hypothetical protein
MRAEDVGTGSECKRGTSEAGPDAAPTRLRRNRADLEPLRSDFGEPGRCQPLTSSLNTLQ